MLTGMLGVTFTWECKSNGNTNVDSGGGGDWEHPIHWAGKSNRMEN